MCEGSEAPAPRPLGGWHGDQPGSAGDLYGGRLRRIGVKAGCFLLVALGAVLVGILLSVRTITLPYFLAIPVQEYTHFPFHWYAFEDCAALKEHFTRSYMAFESQEGQRIVNEMAELRKHSGSPLVVYLTCFALAEGDQVYLLPADARPLDKRSWLKLEEVLDMMGACAEREKLLVLDISHRLADARLGMVSDHVMEGLEKALETRDLSNLSVFCSCTAGQVSLVSEEWQTSVFGHYLDEGLWGAADGWGPRGRKNKHITVSELAAFATHHTDRWALTNRGQRQTPRLWGKGPDFTLAMVTAPPSTETAKPVQVKYPEWLKNAWKLCDALRTKEFDLYAPQVLPSLHDEVLRLEQRWRGMAHVKKDGDEKLSGKEQILAGNWKVLRERVDKVFKFPALSYSATSLAQARMRLRPAPAELVEAVRDGLKRVKEPSGKKDDKADGPLFAYKEGKDEPPPEPAVVAGVLIDAAADLEHPRPHLVSLIHKEIDKRLQRKQFVETVWLKRVVEFYTQWQTENDPGIWKRVGAAVQFSFRAVQKREQLAALMGEAPWLLPWIQLRFHKADEQRRQGETLLLWGRPDQWGQAEEKLQKAGKEYADLLDLAWRIHDARRAMDAALATLPGYVSYLGVAPQSSQGEELWSKARKQAQALTEFFTYAAQPSSELPVEGSSLSFSLDELQRHLETKADYLVQNLESGRGGVSDVEELHGLSAFAGFSAANRERLWEAGRKLRLRLLDATLQSDTADLQSKPPPGVQPVYPRAEDGWQAQAAQALRRARLALDLLTLAGVQGLEPCQQELQQAQNKTKPWEFDVLGQCLGKAWVEQLPKQLAAKPEQTDRLSYLLPLLGTRVEDKASGQALTGQRAVRHREFIEWLAGRHRAEGQYLAQTGHKQDVETSKFFFQAARDLQ